MERKDYKFAGVDYYLITCEAKCDPESPNNDCVEIWGKCPHFNFKYSQKWDKSLYNEEKVFATIRGAVEYKIKAKLGLPRWEDIPSDPPFKKIFS